MQATIGCRFLTVDACPGKVGFYDRFGFVPIRPEKARDGQAIPMYVDLIQIKVAK